MRVKCETRGDFSGFHIYRCVPYSYAVFFALVFMLAFVSLLEMWCVLLLQAIGGTTFS